MSHPSKGRALAIIVGMAWVVAIALGTRPLFVHENTPGVPASPPSQWPLSSGISRGHDKFTLVMFAHPDCPCTRASIAELEMLTTQLPGKLDVIVQFRKPGVSERVARASDLWRKAAAIPGVSVRFDRDGTLVHQFGAEVSGQTMLYDPAGCLVFSGGITGARGHAGDNPAADAVIRRVRGGRSPLQFPVFGCSLRDPDRWQLKRDAAWTK